MELRSLGRSNMQVSVLGLGTVKLGRDRGVAYPETFQIPSRESAGRLLAQAREHRVNLLDTAPAYGTSEETLGHLLRGQRQDWIICTKAGESFQNGRSQFDFSAAAMEQSIQRSLARLQTDYLDIVLIHSDGNDLQILDQSDALPALLSLKEQGLVRAVGISHKTIDGGQRALDLGVDVIMATLNPREDQQRAVVAAAADQGCGVLVKKALSSGHGDPADLAWAAEQTGVCSVVVGTIDPGHLAANAEAVGG